MKDELIRIRVAFDEKVQISLDSDAAGFDSISAYMLNLVRRNRSRLPRRKK